MLQVLAGMPLASRMHISDNFSRSSPFWDMNLPVDRAGAPTHRSNTPSPETFQNNQLFMSLCKTKRKFACGLGLEGLC